MIALPTEFLTRPITHRALHDVSNGRPENSVSAVKAAIARGYGVEIDIQSSADNQPMVFHDCQLDRLSEAHGAIRQCSAADLKKTRLLGSDETIPGLSEILDLIAGRVPVLIEIKDQDGAMGPNVGPLEQAIAKTLSTYQGVVAVMSFNTHSVREMARVAPLIPRGVVTCGYKAEYWPTLPLNTRTRLAGIPDFADVGASFISHDRRDLASDAVAALKTKGVPILCWTIRSAEQETQARLVADNITFEGYMA